MQKPRLMTVVEISHLDKDGNCLWKDEELHNIWHTEGQEFVLAAAFDTDHGTTIPSFYYMGLDGRTTLNASDSLTSLVAEPSTNGYARQSLSSANGFVVGLKSGIMKALSGIVSFTATSDSWGPVSNVFLTTSNDDTGYLIASVELSSARVVLSGESITARVALSFASC